MIAQLSIVDPSTTVIQSLNDRQNFRFAGTAIRCRRRFEVRLRIRRNSWLVLTVVKLFQSPLQALKPIVNDESLVFWQIIRAIRQFVFRVNE